MWTPCGVSSARRQWRGAGYQFFEELAPLQNWTDRNIPITVRRSRRDAAAAHGKRGAPGGCPAAPGLVWACQNPAFQRLKTALERANALTFEAKTTGSDDLKAVVGAISTLLEEATFTADPDAITFKGMDPSHVALIDVKWPNTGFAAYRCDSEVTFGVRVDEFSKLIRRASKGDDISLAIGADNQLQLGIGENKKYKMRLIESSATDAPLPKISFDAKLEMSSSALEKTLGDVQAVSEYVTMSLNAGGVSFSGKGDAGEGSVELPQDDDGIVELSADADSEGTYSLEYLMPVVRAAGRTSGRIVCEFSSAKPLRVAFNISNMGYIHFYLAPRIES